MRGIVIKNEGAVPGPHTVIADNATGAQIHGVEAVDISIRVNEPVRATITLVAMNIGTEAVARFQMIHPETGEWVVVESIRFADGTEFVA
jgi:hypothetical protein